MSDYSLSDYSTYHKNPRKISDIQKNQLAEWLIELGDLSGIVLNQRTHEIISGNQRSEFFRRVTEADLVIDEVYEEMTPKGTVARGHILMESEKYSVRIVDWDEAKEEKANVIANKAGGEFDHAKLLEQFDKENLLTYGFDKDEIAEMVRKLARQETKGDDQIPDSGITIQTKPGDLYKLGNHRVFCGDSTNLEDAEKLMGQDRANLIMTSPPYWVGKEYETQENERQIDDFVAKCCHTIVNCIQTDFSRIVINTGTGNASIFGERARIILLIDKWTNNLSSHNWKLRSIRHWLKAGQIPFSRPSADVVDQHCEFLLTYYCPDGQSRGQNRTNEGWAQMGYFDDIQGNRNQVGHVASFPIELPRRFIELYSDVDEIVVDIFLGAGSTLIACEKSGRKCYGLEIDPKYCDVIVKRYVKFCKENDLPYSVELNGTDIKDQKWLL